MSKSFKDKCFPALTGKSTLADNETTKHIVNIFTTQKWKHTSLNDQEHYFQLGNPTADFWITDSVVELFLPRKIRRKIRYSVIALTIKDGSFNLSHVKGTANEHSSYTLSDSAFVDEAYRIVSRADWVSESTVTNSYVFDQDSFNHPKGFKNKVQ